MSLENNPRQNATQEGKLTKSEDVIGFLRMYNFGSRDEGALTAVKRFVEYMEGIYPKGKASIREIPGTPAEKFPIIDLFVTELERAGFAAPGTISHEKWTKEAGWVLSQVLKDFESHGKKRQDEVSKTHEHW